MSDFLFYHHFRTLKHYGSKICPICKEVFERPSGKSDKVWNNQKCCGRDCSNIYRRKEVTVKPTRRVEQIPGNRRYKGWTS